MLKEAVQKKKKKKQGNKQAKDLGSLRSARAIPVLIFPPMEETSKVLIDEPSIMYSASTSLSLWKICQHMNENDMC